MGVLVAREMFWGTQSAWNANLLHLFGNSSARVTLGLKYGSLAKNSSWYFLLYQYFAFHSFCGIYYSVYNLGEGNQTKNGS